jgi:hypothetical protein
MSTIIVDELEWEDPPRGYYLTDVKQKVLWKNEETGATWVLLKFPPGIADKLHTHPDANQFVYLLSGEIGGRELGGKIASVQLKGNQHGQANFTKESLALFFWDGSPKPEVVE